jgi:PAS domain S-box-containing protein
MDKGEGVPLIRGATKLTSVSSSGARYQGKGMLSRVFFPQSPAPAATGYAFAAGCVAVAFASRLLLEPLLHEQAPLLLFTLAVAASAMRGGFGPGLFSTFLGALGCVYFVPPKGALSIAPEYLPAAAREMAVFFVVGAILSQLGSALRGLRWEALELADQRNEILESITDGFVALDAKCRFVYLNSVAGELLGKPRDEAMGKCLWAEVPELRGSLVEVMFRQVFDKRTAVRFEYLFPSANRWFEIHAHPTQHRGLTASFSDISDRKSAELQLRRTLSERDAALDRVRLLSGLLPICAACKRIRDDGGHWQQIESYISQHSQAKFSHGMCPECGQQYYGELWPQTSTGCG